MAFDVDVVSFARAKACVCCTGKSMCHPPSARPVGLHVMMPVSVHCQGPAGYTVHTHQSRALSQVPNRGLYYSQEFSFMYGPGAKMPQDQLHG